MAGKNLTQQLSIHPKELLQTEQSLEKQLAEARDEKGDLDEE